MSKKINEAGSTDLPIILKLFNAFGERLLAENTSPTNSTIRLNTERLPAGIYFVAIGNVTERFVVAR